MPAPCWGHRENITPSIRLDAIKSEDGWAYFLFCCSACWNCCAKLLMAIKRVSGQSSDELGGGREQREDGDRLGVPFRPRLTGTKSGMDQIASRRGFHMTPGTERLATIQTVFFGFCYPGSTRLSLAGRELCTCGGSRVLFTAFFFCFSP